LGWRGGESSVTSLKLTYVPIEESMHVYLNGLEAQRGDWTYNPVNNKVVGAAGLGELTGDKLECRYAHKGVVPPIIPPVFVGSVTARGDNPTLDLTPLTVLDGDTLIVGVASVGSGGVASISGGTELASAPITTTSSLWKIFSVPMTAGQTSLSITASSSSSGNVVAMGVLTRSAVVGTLAGPTGSTVSTTGTVPVLTGILKDDIALAFAFGSHGTVSGTVSIPGTPYSTLAGISSSLGKVSVDAAYYIMPADGDTPSQGLTYSGTLGGWKAESVTMTHD
jgi:hypothetical protein